MRRHEDGWVFEEPVSEDIAPGYFDVVEKPMDFQTIEKKIENLEYTVKDQVRRKRERGGKKGGREIERDRDREREKVQYTCTCTVILPLSPSVYNRC